jgi:hypothetical protein
MIIDIAIVAFWILALSFVVVTAVCAVIDYAIRREDEDEQDYIPSWYHPEDEDEDE